MLRFLSMLILVTSLFTSTAMAQIPKAPPAVVSASNEVDGLKLPPNQTVPFDEGFVSLHAVTTGTVQWLVLSTNQKVKYKVNPATPNDIDVGISPYPGTITVFAIAVVNGKLTEYARTDITITGAGPPTPPAPVAFALPLHLSYIVDPTKQTDAIKSILESSSLRTQLANKQVLVRQYNINDPIVTQKNFTAVLQKYGAPMLILQDNTGRAIVISALPADVPAVLALLGPYLK